MVYSSWAQVLTYCFITPLGQVRTHFLVNKLLTKFIILPVEWKEANVTALFKKGTKLKTRKLLTSVTYFNLQQTYEEYYIRWMLGEYGELGEYSNT